ncbi:MAG: hypothetical protein A2527_08320 [Candidatus Lambdaproteobacteria bacterium RIFOXYD2_FULL_50_16]|uniref:DUF2249 domain-containing protein n=1 Tax=Candidatus Lambdaproteobacteria bacterium RIFOXYD2_FULL_50_16 TaxID=1817772 RepID=A0A1F6GAN1_9PROT|nr:MAG: hypothetical protein A2527_08320 [Candidatus Lambdaproteobacteria bacterium RIFOXYD2_FULL_50_16]
MSLITLECRQMAPPEPMVAVLEALNNLAPEDQVLMIHRHNPVHLLPILAARGFAYQVKEKGENQIEVLIWRP